jgi:hypothetical protein
MSLPLTLTLFVKASDPASDAARESLQAVLLSLPDDATVHVSVLGEPDAAALGISIAPVLRVQRGTDTPEWIIQFDQRSLFDRLMSLGVLLGP